VQVGAEVGIEQRVVLARREDALDQRLAGIGSQSEMCIFRRAPAAGRGGAVRDRVLGDGAVEQVEQPGGAPVVVVERQGCRGDALVEDAAAIATASITSAEGSSSPVSTTTRGSRSSAEACQASTVGESTPPPAATTKATASAASSSSRVSSGGPAVASTR